jgi:UDPglucose 6-dehydrogenase
MPMAVAIAQCGYRVRGFDLRPELMSLRAVPAYELDAQRRGTLRDLVADEPPDLVFCSLDELVADSDCVFVAVETPHGAEYEGVTRLPDTRADFSYDALTTAITSIAQAADRPVEIGVISTVLPGTIRRQVLPLCDPHNLIYCPQFVAMGSIAFDLRHPEFTLLGYGESKPSVVKDVLEGLRAEEAPTFQVSYESAELAKVTYNTFVSAKVTVANVVQQLADLTGASAHQVFSVLRSADRRLASASYLGPGMGDGGPCHPRDNIAMSWLSRQIDPTTDIFSAIMIQRQAYAEWLADRFVSAAAGRPLVLLGAAYKPGVPLETGSSGLLMAALLAERGHQVTVVRRVEDLSPDSDGLPVAYFLGCPDDSFVEFPFPANSVVVDPWHRVPPTDGVDVVRVGEQP